jgi:hypothetical protein
LFDKAVASEAELIFEDEMEKKNEMKMKKK